MSAVLSTGGCFFSTSDHPHLGTLIVDWTVEGSKDPDACIANAVDRVDVVLRTWDGRFVDEFQENCEEFELAVDLDPGDYEVDALLVDRRGAELTTSVQDDVRIYSGRGTVSAVDFPPSSFF